MTDYKFRAECFLDVVNLLTELLKIDGIVIGNVQISPDTTLPDCEVSLQCSLSLDELKAITHNVDDGHVMRETMQTADCYTGERQ